MTPEVRLRPARFTTRDPVLQDVPGTTVRRRRLGDPVNCARLLTRSMRIMLPPPLKAFPPIPELRPHALTELTAYQRRELLATLGHTGAHFWWATGAGKTWAATVWALAVPGPVVVVTRANVRYQFAREIERLATVSVRVLTGNTPEEIAPTTRVVVLGWETLRFWRESLERFLQRGGKGCLVLDEVHRAKAWRRQEKRYDRARDRNDYVWLDTMASAAARLARVAHRRLGLTATPFRDTLMDLWGQLDTVEPDCWGTSWEFAHRYCDAQLAEHGGLDTTGRSNEVELKARLRECVSIVKMSEAMADLPPKRRQVALIRVEEQNTAGAFANEFKRAAKQGKRALLEMKLAEAAARKRRWVVDYCLDWLRSGKNVTIFTGRREEVDRYAATFREEFAKDATLATFDALWAGHGEQSEQERDLMIEGYRAAKKGALLIGTHDAFGEGKDGMQCTDLAMFAFLPYTHGVVVQSEGRFAGRRGQDRPVLIVYPVAQGTYDEHVADLLLEKLEAVDHTVAELGVQDEAGATAAALSGEDDEDAILLRLLERM
jgi:superfamily II DNA or RNA helicase